MRLLTILIGLFISVNIFAERKDILINENWQFRYNYQVRKGSEQLVNLPHTWNAQDSESNANYYRGIGNYTKELFIDANLKGKRLFLRFEGVNSIANVLLNGYHIGEHRGGYNAFIFEITEKVKYGKKNNLLVRVNNSPQLDIMPLVGDFNIYGGIYRDVHLIITDEVNISLTNYASSGVYLTQEFVSKDKANVKAKVCLSNSSSTPKERNFTIKVYKENEVIWKKTDKITITPGESSKTIDIKLNNPRLWNGRKDPFMYKVEISLAKDNIITDHVCQPLGLRYYKIDQNKGFCLNGEYIKLQGVCRHQERSEFGNALHKVHHDEDAAIIAEMGANAVRLAHYPQSSYVYDLMDKYGFITWAEIPFVGPGGYLDRGFINQESFCKNGIIQLKELIHQNYNHPSICFWGLFNELKTSGDNPVDYVRELNNIAHNEDPTRLTAAATNTSIKDPICSITDVIAWNLYMGWYGGSPSDMGDFVDYAHTKYPNYKLAISEYGAGASIWHQQDSISRVKCGSYWHPENYQTYYHMENWKILAERPFVWGSFVWCMFDFGSTNRTEGDRAYINDKGLVTRDRKIRKDAYFFYKANWNREEPMVYISNRRNTIRKKEKTDIMAFTNLSHAELFINNKSFGKSNPDKFATCLWKNIQLSKGENVIVIKAQKGKIIKTDKTIWYLE